MDVKTLCLGVLSFGDKSGYEIKQVFEDAFSHFFVAGYGSIYPALADLAEEGLVTCAAFSQSGRPDKKVYSLTEAGRHVFVKALKDTPPRHKIRSEFLVLLYFAHLLPPERLAAVLAERERDIEALLTHIQVSTASKCECTGPAQEFATGFAQVTLEAQLTYIRAHKAELLERLATAADSPPA